MRLARVAGIEIWLHWSLLPTIALLVVGLADGVLGVWHPDWSPWLTWAVAAGAGTLLLATLLVHELAHAVVGRAFGMTIGRITLFLLGGLAHLEDEPRSWRAELMMALAGPATSLALGVAATLAGLELARPLPGNALDLQAMSGLPPLPTVLLWLGPVNVAVGLFNLLPGFPLDGGRVLRSVVWGITGNQVRATRLATGAGRAVGLTLAAAGLAMAVGVPVPFLGVGLGAGLWVALMGVFLQAAAHQGRRQLEVRELLRSIEVAAIMETRLERLAPEDPLSAVPPAEGPGGARRAFPVEDHGRLVGLLTAADLAKADGRRAPERPVQEVMTPAERLATVGPHEDAARALRLLGARGVRQLPVVESGRVVGLLRREDLARWLLGHGQALESGGAA